MSKKVDLTRSKFVEIPSLDDGEAKSLSQLSKGWSFSYVYNFSEIRDVFVALKKFRNTNFELNEFFMYCESIQLPFVRTKWNKRRLLEHLNALKNFGLVDSKYMPLEVGFTSEIGSNLVDGDLVIFRKIYFNYFRFKEIISWFIDPTPSDRIKFIEGICEAMFLHESVPLFVFSNNSRFTDSFIYSLENGTTVYYIDSNSDEDLMRFWDVFVKWGLELGVLEKFNLKNLDVRTLNDKSIACVYAINDSFNGLDLLEYLNVNHDASYVYLPDLVLELMTKFRQRVETIHQLIIDQYKIHKDFFSFERTSEIFVKRQEIKNGDRIFFPKYNDSYVSHLIVRR